MADEACSHSGPAAAAVPIRRRPPRQETFDALIGGGALVDRCIPGALKFCQSPATRPRGPLRKPLKIYPKLSSTTRQRDLLRVGVGIWYKGLSYPRITVRSDTGVEYVNLTCSSLEGKPSESVATDVAPT